MGDPLNKNIIYIYDKRINFINILEGRSSFSNVYSNANRIAASSLCNSLRSNIERKLTKQKKYVKIHTNDYQIIGKEEICV